MLSTILSIIFVLALAGFLFSRKCKTVKNLPPGPGGMPLFGNVLQIGKRRPYLKLTDWVKQYGKMYTIHLAHIPTLVINDTALMKDLFGRMAATGRYQSDLLTMTTWNGSYGPLTTEGKVWVEQSQFCFRTLRQFGFGKLSWMEPMLLEDVEDLCDWITKESAAKGKVVLKEMLLLSTSNSLWTMITGERTELSHSKFVHISAKWINHVTRGAQTGLAFFPWLRYLAPVKSGYNDLKSWCDKVQELVPGYFQQHKASRKNGDAPRDMIDAYIDKVENCKDSESTFFGEDGWKHSYSAVTLLLVAGGNALANVLNWLTFLLSVHPNVQRELQKEIDAVVGKDRNPSFEDKPKMPVMESVILETLRYASSTTLSGFVRLLDDVEFHGYTLPKGMMLIANLYHVQHDKRIWGDPENFRPNRFLQEGGDNLKEFVVAFQPGRRACPGEFFARDTLFLFASKIFQNFTFSMDPSIGDAKLYLDATDGFIRHSKVLPVVAEARI